MPPDDRPVMVCLISRQTMQNLLPILQYRPQLASQVESGSGVETDVPYPPADGSYRYLSTHYPSQRCRCLG